MSNKVYNLLRDRGAKEAKEFDEVVLKLPQITLGDDDVFTTLKSFTRAFRKFLKNMRVQSVDEYLELLTQGMQILEGICVDELTDYVGGRAVGRATYDLASKSFLSTSGPDTNFQYFRVDNNVRRLSRLIQQAVKSGYVDEHGVVTCRFLNVSSFALTQDGKPSTIQPCEVILVINHTDSVSDNYKGKIRYKGVAVNKREIMKETCSVYEGYARELGFDMKYEPSVTDRVTFYFINAVDVAMLGLFAQAISEYSGSVIDNLGSFDSLYPVYIEGNFIRIKGSSNSGLLTYNLLRVLLEYVLRPKRFKHVIEYHRSYSEEIILLEKLSYCLEKQYEDLLTYKNQLEYEQEQERIGKIAGVWDEKKNRPQWLEELCEGSRLLIKNGGIFEHIDVDEGISVPKFALLEDELLRLHRPLLSKLSSITPKSLHVRKLGKHKALGLYNPRLNSVGVDVRMSASFLHEYGHALDYGIGKRMGRRSMSLDTAFKQVRDAYYKYLNAKEFAASVRRYLSVPTEVFARAFEVWYTKKTRVLSSKYIASRDEYIRGMQAKERKELEGIDELLLLSFDESYLMASVEHEDFYREDVYPLVDAFFNDLFGLESK